MLLFKFPFTETIYRTTDGDSGEKTVSFVSFDEKKRIDFRGAIKEVTGNEVKEEPYTTPNLSNINRDSLPEETKEEYTEKLTAVIDFIRKNNLQKLVISRQKQVRYNDLSPDGAIDLNRSFLSLCSSYPNAFVYLFQKDGICWMGAFSELLGKFNKKTSEFETMSLAGTLPIAESWTEKESEEQKPVSLFIKKILERYSADVEISDTYDHISGNIKHLRTDYKAQINAYELENLISELHPTPAVCGIPKEVCKNAIATFEKYPRRYYAGYIRSETDEFIRYFVNLRCAEFTATTAYLYVGGGITAQSDPEKEWRETELKAEAVLKNLVTA
jgi:isochorismate synthase